MKDIIMDYNYLNLLSVKLYIEDLVLHILVNVNVTGYLDLLVLVKVDMYMTYTMVNHFTKRYKTKVLNGLMDTLMNKSFYLMT